MHLLGLVALRGDDIPQAIELIRGSIAILPTQPAALVNLSHAYLRCGKSQAALAACDTALEQRWGYPEALIGRGNALLELKRPAEALASYDHAISVDSRLSEAHSNRGRALRELGRDAEALASYERAAQIAPGLLAARIGRAEMLRVLHRPQEALLCCDELLQLAPGNSDGLQTRAAVLLDLNRPDEALQDLDRAVQGKPDHAGLLLNRGNALFRAGRVTDALASYERVLQISPDNTEAYFNRGNALLKVNRFDAALASYDAAIAKSPGLTKAHYYRGNTLRQLGRSDEALRCYARALQLDPGYAAASCGMGNALRELDRPAEALVYYDDALKREPDNIESLSNKGVVLLALKRPEDAMRCFERLLEMDADHAHFNLTLGFLVHAHILCCDWRDYESNLAALMKGVDAGELVTMPSLLTLIADSARTLLRCARRYTEANWPAADLPPLGPYGHQKIRVAYVSADFREHPVSQLMVGVFEAHDRSRFEVIGISLRAGDGSALARRVAAAFDRFIDVAGQNDRAIAAQLREVEIDIAVDLTGYTEGSRSGIFAQRIAPVQINFLGYPGTLAAPYIDYLIADRIVIPEEDRDSYLENIIRMPECFLPPDSSATVGSRPNRAEHGLPSEGFVFCCFNYHHKILPAVFDVWMRLLGAVDGSLLWLANGTDVVTRNLTREAQARGIGAERLVFAPRLYDLGHHLARYRVADLFLDTVPYNAHKTALDALWAGLPLLTTRGGAFPGRVAASLLSSIGLPELIADSLEDYETLALRLAKSPAALRDIRVRLASARQDNALFDGPRYRRHLESAYTTVWERAERNERPSAFAVPPIPSK
jgi:predicted O-linked N-acetylglucosamine transferase (SPINDLY family)